MISFTFEEGKQVEVLTESVCFRIDPEFTSVHVLPLLSVIQCYMYDCKAKTTSWNVIHNQNRKHILDLTIVCGDIYMRDFLIEWLRKEKDFYRKMSSRKDLQGVQISNFDYYVDITLEKILDVVRVGHLHFHQGVAALLGCNSKSLPNLPTEETRTYESGTLVLANFDDFKVSESKQEEIYGDKFKELLVVTADEESMMPLSLIELLRKSEAVIGRRGFTTYAASCLGKPVLEVVNAEDYFWFLTQWSNKYYLPYILDSKFDLRQGVKRLWEFVNLARASLITTTVSSAQEIPHE